MTGYDGANELLTDRLDVAQLTDTGVLVLLQQPFIPLWQFHMVFACSTNKAEKLHERPLMLSDGRFFIKFGGLMRFFIPIVCLFLLLNKLKPPSGWVLAVCDVTLHDARATAIPEQRAPLDVQRSDILELLELLLRG